MDIFIFHLLSKDVVFCAGTGFMLKYHNNIFLHKCHLLHELLCYKFFEGRFFKCLCE